MKIIDIEVVVLETPGEYGSEAGGDLHGIKYTCVFVVRTDEGITGYSQIESQPHVAAAIVEAPGEGSGFFSGLRSLGVGEDPLQVEALWSRLFLGSYYYGRRGAVIQAISGIDIACWDILGKATGLPVCTLLGGRRRDRATAYASTLFRPSPAEVRASAEEYGARGFRAVKFGWGPFGEDARRDIALAEAARDGLGPDRELMIDAGWRRRRTAKEAINLVRSIEHVGPYWVEEPCFPDDYETYRRLTESVSVRIAAGEAETSLSDFHRLVDGPCVDVVQPDLSRCGGLTIGRRVAYLADAKNVQLCPHAWGSELLTAATLHFVAFLPADTFLEFNVSGDPVSRGLLAIPFEVRDGQVEVPAGPGLGVEVDEERLAALRAPR